MLAPLNGVQCRRPLSGRPVINKLLMLFISLLTSPLLDRGHDAGQNPNLHVMGQCGKNQGRVNMLIGSPCDKEVLMKSKCCHRQQAEGHHQGQQGRPGGRGQEEAGGQASFQPTRDAGAPPQESPQKDVAGKLSPESVFDM